MAALSPAAFAVLFWGVVALVLAVFGLGLVAVVREFRGPMDNP